MQAPPLLVFVLLASALAGCHPGQTAGPATPIDLTPYGLESTGQEHLIAALDEIQSFADLVSGPLGKSAADTVVIRGEVTPDGYGAVVTERHAYPKGLLLISVRRSFGKGGGRMVTETKHYISQEAFRADQPQQASTTEMYALSRDTIVAYVRRAGNLETYTFRFPVVTRTDLGDPGLTRVVSRFGLDGMIVSETRDGNGALIQVRRSTGLSDGSLVTRVEYPDGSWRATRTIGRADGTVFREITSGN